MGQPESSTFKHPALSLSHPKSLHPVRVSLSASHAQGGPTGGRWPGGLCCPRRVEGKGMDLNGETDQTCWSFERDGGWGHPNLPSHAHQCRFGETNNLCRGSSKIRWIFGLFHLGTLRRGLPLQMVCFLGFHVNLEITFAVSKHKTVFLLDFHEDKKARVVDLRCTLPRSSTEKLT